MKKRTILSIQNIACETLGTLTDLFQLDGYEIENIKAATNRVPNTAGKYAAIIILGGPMAVYDDISYLEKEKQLITHAIRTNVPVLGICLGSQLIAEAAGGRVYPGPKKEIGWYNVTITPNGHKDLFKGMKTKTMRVFQWHGDTYDLPSGASIMASSRLYPQAFRIGNAIGIQFHLEVNSKMIRKWIEEYHQEIKNEHIKLEDIMPSKRNEIETLFHNCKVFYSNFSKIINNK
jgi:GMP synthase-like glutamine amidotransferase